MLDFLSYYRFYDLPKYARIHLRCFIAICLVPLTILLYALMLKFLPDGSTPETVFSYAFLVIAIGLGAFMLEGFIAGVVIIFKKAEAGMNKPSGLPLLLWIVLAAIIPTSDAWIRFDDPSLISIVAAFILAGLGFTLSWKARTRNVPKFVSADIEAINDGEELLVAN